MAEPTLPFSENVEILSGATIIQLANIQQRYYILSVLSPSRTLCTLLCQLIELLNGAVEQGYADSGLDYRPRYKPVLRVLITYGPVPIKTLATHAGLTHSAASQTVAQMRKHGLIDIQKGKDRREQVVSLTSKATAMIPAIQRAGQATEAAADALEAELGFSLSQHLEDAVAALDHQSFAERCRFEAARLETDT